MRHGLGNTTIHTRENGTLIQVHPHYESVCINRYFKQGFSTLTISCTVIQTGHKYFKNLQRDLLMDAVQCRVIQAP